MRRNAIRQSPALALAALALFVAMGGSVYAAAKINGRSIRAKSLPGNRLKPRSLPANRLKPGLLRSLRRPRGRLTGADIDEATLRRVPLAIRAEVAGHAASAERARSALDAQTALNAVNAVDSKSVNGYEAGCGPGTTAFAGACWEASARPAASAAVAASECAAAGGELPEALTLAAFAQRADIVLATGDEWSSEVTAFSGDNIYAVVTVSSDAVLEKVLRTNTRQYRCVTPLLS